MKNLIILLFFVSFAAQAQIDREHDSLGAGLSYSGKENSFWLHLNRIDHRIIDDFSVDYFYPQFGTISRRFSNGYIITFSEGGPPGDTRSWRQWFLDNRAHFEGFGLFDEWPSELKKVRVGNINLRMRIEQFNSNPELENSIRVMFSGTRGNYTLPSDAPIGLERFGTIPSEIFPCECTPPVN